MRILLLNGADKSHRKAEEICRFITETCETHGHVVTEMVLRDMEITYWLPESTGFHNTPGMCRVENDMRKFVKKLTRSHVVIAVTPITCGGYSFDLNRVFQRSIPKKIPHILNLKKEAVREDAYEQSLRYLAIGILSEADEAQEKRFRKLVERSEANFNSQIVSSRVILDSQPSEVTREEVKRLLQEVVLEKAEFPSRRKTKKLPDPTKKKAL
ncbi:MAG: NAD(P)H-dependent oxidoreductase [Bacillota bacterium]|nr:NAD(P)H-dependent oxidoreductase [Bacillota bacterium]